MQKKYSECANIFETKGNLLLHIRIKIGLKTTIKNSAVAIEKVDQEVMTSNKKMQSRIIE